MPAGGRRIQRGLVVVHWPRAVDVPVDIANSGPNPFALLSLIAAPAVLTNAASVLALSTSNRFLRASERMRGLTSRYAESLPDEARALMVKQIARVERQAVMLLNALRAAYVAIGSFVSASLISILGAGVAASHWHEAFPIFAGIALLVGVFGAFGIVVACVNLLGSTRLALMNMTEEAEVIVRREQARDQAAAAGASKA
jgi:hypothetical protein